jgi:hypothetical protein
MSTVISETYRAPGLPIAALRPEADGLTGSTIWPRLSINEAKRNGWWDSVLRRPRQSSVLTAKALRELTLARKLIGRMAWCMDWPDSYYLGFTCLAGVVSDFDVPAIPPANTRPQTSIEPTVTRFVAKLLECHPIPSGWLIISLAKEENLSPGLVLTTLGRALLHCGRPLDAARQFDTALMVIYALLPDLRSVADQQVTVVENYRGYKILFYRGRFYAHGINNVEVIIDFSAELAKRAEQRRSNATRSEGPPIYDADRFQEVLSMIDGNIVRNCASLAKASS